MHQRELDLQRNRHLPCQRQRSINANVDLPVGTQVTFVAQCTVDPTSLNGVVITNTATVTAPAGTIELDPADNSATDTTTVNASGAIVSGTKTVSGSLAQGSRRDLHHRADEQRYRAG